MEYDLALNAIKSFGLDTSTPVFVLRESADNRVFLVGTAKKKILRISKRLPKEDTDFECQVVDYLAKRGVKVARFLPAESGKYFAFVGGSVAVLFEFLEGHHIQVDKDHLPAPDEAYEAGKGLALIHNAGADFVPASARHRTIFSELERVSPLREIFIREYDGGEKFVQEAEAMLTFGRASNEPLCMIHNDYRAANVFFDQQNRLSGIIDFDWSCMGPAIKDVAHGAMEWSYPDGAAGADFNVFDAFLAGYNCAAQKKVEKNKNLFQWVRFCALSDAATYFCDSIGAPDARKKIGSSYMYKKFRFFTDLNI